MWFESLEPKVVSRKLSDKETTEAYPLANRYEARTESIVFAQNIPALRLTRNHPCVKTREKTGFERIECPVKRG
jgi:hypothetical protein